MTDTITIPAPKFKRGDVVVRRSMSVVPPQNVHEARLKLAVTCYVIIEVEYGMYGQGWTYTSRQHMADTMIRLWEDELVSHQEHRVRAELELSNFPSKER